MKLFAHQQEALDIGKKSNVALFHDCGTGKTATTLNLIKAAFERGEGPALVVCPKNLIEDAWMSDAKDFFPTADIIAVHGDPEKRKKTLYQDHDIYVTTPETYKNMYNDIQDKKFGVLVVDESSNMKAHDSQITRALLALAGFKTRAKGGITFQPKHVIPNRYPLTATAAPNTPLEYWAQIKLVTGPGNEVFNDNFFVFRSKFFYSIDLGRTGIKIWKFRKTMFAEFCYCLSKVAHVCRKDILNLPGQVHHIHDIQLSQKEQAAYDSFKRDLVLELGKESVIAASALTEVMKLRQLTSGFIYGDNTHQIGLTKYMYQKELLSQNNTDQHIIWINFKQEAELLKGLSNSVVLDGESKNNDDIIKSFKNGNVQYLIANMQSASHGLTFVNSHRASYYSQNYSYELMKQSSDRQDRIGQKHLCHYNHLIAKGTIDPVVRSACVRKEIMNNTFLDCLVQIQNGQTPDFTNCDNVFTQSYGDILKKFAQNHLFSKEEDHVTDDILQTV